MKPFAPILALSALFVAMSRLERSILNAIYLNIFLLNHVGI